ncbi:MAG: 4-(cytidine 5'-diphospho)-2-C-methyl-D-erythritol kinase [Gemmatimonadetes bacterium]|nr:4-(cytidine 5'-diphospho)-2-C-methyl-D-erythritol kinase [Gemmatimonadota bacterium]
MTRAARVRAQAKINLSLRFLAREVSGYHQIETIFQRLDLADEVRVELTAGSRTLTCGGPMLPPDGLGRAEDNLAWRAAAAYLDAIGSTDGFRIEIVKHIPSGGGLGGGSADAGAVLRVLQHLLGGLTKPQLFRLAGSLGADVPFLTQDANPLALGWGRGDRLLGLPTLPGTDCLVVVAPFGVNTAAAYGWVAARGAPLPGAAFMSEGAWETWAEVGSTAVNEFEEVVFAHHPQLASAFSRLSALGAGVLARMSGSGSTLYALSLDRTPLPSELPELPEGFRLVPTRTATGVEPLSVE